MSFKKYEETSSIRIKIDHGISNLSLFYHRPFMSIFTPFAGLIGFKITQHKLPVRHKTMIKLSVYDLFPKHFFYLPVIQFT